MIVAAALVVLGVGLLGGLFLLLRSIPDDHTARLKSAPGYDFPLPNADKLSESVGESVANAGTNKSVYWGVHGTLDDLTRYADETLATLGYRKVSGRGVDDSDPTLIGDYWLDDTRFTITWFRLPHRVPDGRFIVSGYDFIVHTVIANGENARRGP